MIYNPYSNASQSAVIGAVRHHKVGFLCFKECRCKKSCDSKFVEGDPRRTMCKEWCRAQKPAVDKSPPKSFFEVSQDEIEAGRIAVQEKRDARRETAAAITNSVVNAAANVGVAYMTGGASMMMNGGGFQAGPTPAEIEAARKAEEEAKKLAEEEEKTFLQKYGLVIGGVSAVAVIGTAIYAISKKKG